MDCGIGVFGEEKWVSPVYLVGKVEKYTKRQKIQADD